LSEKCNITCGVPQGSIIGPTLFLIYINDIYKVSSFLNFVLFADDTNVFKSGRNIKDLIHSINKELINVERWFKSNKLTLNVKKTNFIIFSRTSVSTKNKIILGSNEIEQVSCITFLGVHIDDKLSWTQHIAHVTSKVNKCIGVLCKLRNAFPKSVLLQLYKSLVYPHLYYCNSIWGSALPSHLSPLYIAQKKALKIALRIPVRTPTTTVFSYANVLTLSGINRVQISIFMYKYVNNLLPSVFLSKFTLRSDVHSYNTRSSTHFNVKPADFKPYKSSMSFKGPNVWDKLPDLLKNSVSLTAFKSNVKKFFL